MDRKRTPAARVLYGSVVAVAGIVALLSLIIALYVLTHIGRCSETVLVGTAIAVLASRAATIAVLTLLYAGFAYVYATRRIVVLSLVLVSAALTFSACVFIYAGQVTPITVSARC